VRRLLATALVLALLPLVSAHAEDPAADARKKRVEAARAALLAERKKLGDEVNAAIDRGVVWLRGQQRSKGNFPAYGDRLPSDKYDPMDLGVNALVLLTLAKSGVPAGDKTLEKGLSHCRSDLNLMKGRKKVTVYSAATFLMALDAIYNPQAKDETVVEVEADAYGTTTRVTRKKTPCKYPAGVQPLVEELAKILRAAQVPSVGGWRYPGAEGSVPGIVDLSNTQYAMLGLAAAARCGIAVPLEVWTKALEYLLKEQDADGFQSELFIQNPAYEPGESDPPRWLSAGKRKARGWTYLPAHKDPNTGSMTCAGVTCLAIVKERLTEAGKCPPDVARRIDAAMLDGLAWLSDAYTVKDNPVVPTAPAMWHYYYLYGLERVGAFTGVRHHQKRDWYAEGARFLLSGQGKDGHWPNGAAGGKPSDNTESEVVQTCFALLFLKRSTAPPTVPITPPVLTGDPDDAPADERGK
jgi:hypothetical protein